MIAKSSTAASLVHKCAVLPAVACDGGRNTFPPQTNSSRVLKSLLQGCFTLVRSTFGAHQSEIAAFVPSQNEPHKGVKLTVVQFKPAT